MSTTETEINWDELWSEQLTNWAGEDPTEETGAELRRQATTIKLYRTLSSATARQAMEVGADLVETFVAGTVAKSMHDLAKAIDKREDMDSKAKSEALTWLVSLASLVVGAADVANRVAAGKDPKGPDSFTASMRQMIVEVQEARSGQ